jgi:hypothetical protein
MYDYDYGPKFLAIPDRVEVFEYEGEMYDLEIRTHLTSYEDDAELTVLFRLCNPNQDRTALAIGTYLVSKGEIQWHDYQGDYSFSREGFHETFRSETIQIAKEMGLAEP